MPEDFDPIVNVADVPEQQPATEAPWAAAWKVLVRDLGTVGRLESRDSMDGEPEEPLLLKRWKDGDA